MSDLVGSCSINERKGLDLKIYERDKEEDQEEEEVEEYLFPFKVSNSLLQQFLSHASEVVFDISISGNKSTAIT